MNPSDTTLTGFSIEDMLPMLIMEDTVGYVPPQERMGLESEKVPVIPKIRIRTDLPGSSMKKRYGSCKSKVVSVLLMKDEEAAVEIRFPNDIPPKPPKKLVK